MRIGEFDLKIVRDGLYALDGGAMFGTVPRVLWEKLWPPDEKNRITLGLNALLICGKGKKILVDCGIGGKFEPRMVERFKIRRDPDIVTSLEREGISPEEIDIQVLTHLHFDHAGGGTAYDEKGNARPVFPNAVRIIQGAEWRVAQNPDPRSHASYLPENFVPYVEGELKLIEGSMEVVPGVLVVKTGGHTPGHQIVIIEDGGETAIYWGDLIPTRKHLKIPYVMGYDTHPLITMQRKRSLLFRLWGRRVLFIFEHDPELPAAWYAEEEGRWEMVEEVLRLPFGEEEKT